MINQRLARDILAEFGDNPLQFLNSEEIRAQVTVTAEVLSSGIWYRVKVYEVEVYPHNRVTKTEISTQWGKTWRKIAVVDYDFLQGWAS